MKPTDASNLPAGEASGEPTAPSVGTAETFFIVADSIQDAVEWMRDGIPVYNSAEAAQSELDAWIKGSPAPNNGWLRSQIWSITIAPISANDSHAAEPNPAGGNK
jgi:hypothetical protein